MILFILRTFKLTVMALMGCIGFLFQGVCNGIVLLYVGVFKGGCDGILALYDGVVVDVVFVICVVLYFIVDWGRLFFRCSLVYYWL